MSDKERKRLYNSKEWKELREAVFLRDMEVCQVCGVRVSRAKGHPHSAVGNHKIKHNNDPELFYDIDNIETVGKSCHDGFIQSLEKSFGLSHPYWLEPSAVPIEIVCGPAGAGKTTYCLENAGPKDIIIDLDDMREEITGKRHSVVSGDDLGQMLHLRNKKLSSLKSRKAGKAYFIVGAPTRAEREWWRDKLQGKIVLISTSRETCIERVRSSGQWRIDAVNRWFSPKQFTPPQAKTPIGLDGWPTN